MIGADAPTVITRLLALLGRPLDEPVRLSFLDGPPPADQLQRELQARGLIVRVVSLGGDGLVSLPSPSVVQTHDGGWVVIQTRWRSTLIVDDGRDVRAMSVATLWSHLSGQALEITPALGLPADLWRALVPILHAKLGMLAPIVAVSFMVQLAGLFPPLISKVALDSVFPNGLSAMLNTITIALVMVGAFQAWFTWLRQRAVLMLRTELQVRIERGFVHHVLRIPYSSLQRLSIGELMQSMSGLAEARHLLTDRVVGLLLDGVMSVAYLVAMIAMLPSPAAMVAAVAAVMAALSLLLASAQARAARSEVQAEAAQRTFMLDALSGITTLKAMGVELAVVARWSGLAIEQLRASLRRQRLATTAEIVLEGTKQMLAIAVLIWGGYSAMTGRVTLGSFVAFSQLATGFLTTINGLAAAVSAVLILRPRLAKAQALAHMQTAPTLSRSHLPAPVAVDAKEVWFRYLDPWVLSGYDLHVRAGATHWLQGPSGSGKSTLLRVLAGLEVPEQGSVRIGSTNPATTTGAASYMPQQVHLFGGTVWDNLRILSAYASPERIRDVAEDTGLASLIRSLPMQYETVLPPGGIGLSGGQRQLIALTAALASDKVVLLLDEPFANLDVATRARLSRCRWFSGRTIVYASHEGGLDR